jgi:hypothetical protein
MTESVNTASLFAKLMVDKSKKGDAKPKQSLSKVELCSRSGKNDRLSHGKDRTRVRMSFDHNIFVVRILAVC